MKNKYIHLLISLLLFCLISFLISPDFLQISNLITIVRQASILLVLSLGLTMVILTGNIDLSVAQTAAFAGCICAKIMTSGYSILFAVGISLLIGIAVGCVNGLLTGWIGLPSFVATYGMNMLISGLALMVMNGGIIYDLPQGFTWFGIGYIGPIPVLIVIAVFLSALFSFALRKTTIGRNISMVGFNKRASVYSGVNTLKTILFAYILCGITAAIGGLLMTARLNAADAGMGETYGLTIVAAVVVGGTPLSGGEGSVEGTIFGTILLTMITNLMNMRGIDSNWQNFVMGVIILLMVGYQSISFRTKNSRRRA